MTRHELSEKLVLACHILAAEGHGDMILGHVSVRIPGEERVLMKGAGLGLEEVTEIDLVEIDLDGRVVAGAARRHSEYPIHTEIFRARDDVGAVVHTHPPHAVALGATGATIEAIGHEGVLFAGAPVFAETTALIRTREEGAAVAACLGRDRAVLLRNHGIVVAGGNIEEAVVYAILLEKAARVQLLAGDAGHRRATASSELTRKVEQIYHERNIQDFFDYYSRRVRGTAPFPHE
ncbi:MAG TPA: class II aldolase/adducin family protein [Thermoleophilia bacterium]|nr:class II aldolase/adducin family protein [Thermoleophilia bacterium]